MTILPRSRRGLWGVLAIVLVAALVYGSIAFTGLAKGRSGIANEFGHIHGLGIDPTDNNLYVATHFGLFRYPRQGKPALVAGRVRDFMGFTVVGPRHFLASGHPGELEGGRRRWGSSNPPTPATPGPRCP
jgi:hypothetical protein